MHYLFKVHYISCRAKTWSRLWSEEWLCVALWRQQWVWGRRPGAYVRSKQFNCSPRRWTNSRMTANICLVSSLVSSNNIYIALHDQTIKFIFSLLLTAHLWADDDINMFLFDTLIKFIKLKNYFFYYFIHIMIDESQLKNRKQLIKSIIQMKKVNFITTTT